MLDNDRMSNDRKNRVFIGGITEDIRKDEIEKEFNKYGKLTSVWVAQNPPGFAFVEYERESDAEEAVRSMNGNSIPGTSAKLRVEHSRGRSQGGRGGGRGRGGGGFGGGRDRFGGGSRGGRDGGYGGSRDGGYGGGRGGGYSGGRGGGFGGSRGSYDRGGRGGDRRGGGGGGRFDSRSGGSSRGRDRDYGGHDSYKSSGSSNYPNYRSRSPISQGRRQSFGARDYSPAGVNSYSSGGNYMSGGNSGY